MSAVRSTSLAAYKSLSAKPMRDQILDIIEEFGSSGCIVDDLSIECFDRGICKQNSTITARIVELEDGSEIFRNGDTRVARSGRQQLIIRHSSFLSSVLPLTIKKPKNPFLAGMMFAARSIVKADASFKGTAGAIALKSEILKVARK